MKKVITCNKCGKGGLVWATSKAGKYYLTDQDSSQITGENGRVIKTLQLAHKCLTPEEQDIKATYSQACDRAADLRAQISKLASEMDARRDSDEWYQIVIVQRNTDTISDALHTEWQSLVAELKDLQIKYNDTFTY
jgi:hypothetical protein